MPILLKTIRIAGFRAHKNIEVDLGRQTILIGTNNVGKTTLLNALQLALGDGHFSLTPDDFHLENGVPCSELLVDLLFCPIDVEGNLSEDFDQTWISVLGKGIKDDGEQQFFAFRTRASSDEMDKNLVPSRCILNQWLDSDDQGSWQVPSIEGESFRVSSISKVIPLYFQNAQRDILDDIRQRSSYLGKALSKISYDASEQQALQELIQEVNDKAVQSSDILKLLKENLSQLGNTFGTTQGSADITPFAKNIRDLTKSVRLHFHDGVENLSMEYHGMGTRSWSSLLVLKAFVQIIAKEAEQTDKPFYPILALEEPEAHLHPNAQKQIMGQIKGFPGQIIVSTHSPYVVAQVSLLNCRLLQRLNADTSVNQVTSQWSSEDIRKIHNHVIQSHGELLFSRQIILCEGETEEQLIPNWIKAYTGKDPYELGLSVVGVGGYGNIQIFMRIFYDLKIPQVIFADNDGNVQNEINKHLRQIAGQNDSSLITLIFLDSPNDIEAQLLSENYRDLLVQSIIRYIKPTFVNQRHEAAKIGEIQNLTDSDLLVKLREMKCQYSAQLGNIFVEMAEANLDSVIFPKHFLLLATQIGLQKRRIP